VTQAFANKSVLSLNLKVMLLAVLVTDNVFQIVGDALSII